MRKAESSLLQWALTHEGHNKLGRELQAIEDFKWPLQITGGTGVLVKTSKELGSSLFISGSFLGSKTLVHYCMISLRISLLH